VTLTFDLLTLTADRFIPLPRGPVHLCRFAAESVFIRFQNIAFTSLVINEGTNGQVESRADIKNSQITTECRTASHVSIVDRLSHRRECTVGLLRNGCTMDAITIGLQQERYMYFLARALLKPFLLWNLYF